MKVSNQRKNYLVEKMLDSHRCQKDSPRYMTHIDARHKH